jgi:eukaryotic-like serine/threonine-protein kinase
VPELLHQLQLALRDRYVVERELGRGGMAFVFLGRERRYERPVAIKVLDPSIATAVGAERFLREIQITAQLQHPHIVPLLDSGEANGLLYSVMTYVEGDTLRDRLIERGLLPVGEAVTLALEVADALEYAHRRGVIHRDIKPENILISNGHAVVTDFGVARAIGLAGGATLTGAGFPIGTAAYMSPEQATAVSPVDGRSDLYSLGCVLYEMLAGRMAFSGPNLKSILTQQVTTDPPLAHISRPGVPVSVVSVVRRALAKKPEDRFQTAAEMADGLREALPELPRISSGAEAVASSRAPREGSGRWASAGRWIIPAAAAALLALAFTFVFPSRRATSGRLAAEGPYNASVAVLPFKNLTRDSSDEYFSEGLTDEIIAQLAQVESLKVISRTSVMALKGSNLTLPQIAETLGVRHVVEGSVRRLGNKVRVSAELIEARTDAHLWAGTVEGNLADSFRVQEEIARKVSNQLLSSIRGVRPMTAGAIPTQSAAFDAVLRGRYLLERRTAESLAGALSAFQDAVRLDSSYAAAFAGLSEANSVWVYYGYRGQPNPYLASARAVAMAERAIVLDPQLAEGHHAYADAMELAKAPEEQILEQLRQAQRLRPGSAPVQVSLAFALAKSGRYAQAIAQAQQALALDPLSTAIRHSLIVLALGGRQYDLAFNEARRARSFSPGDPIPAVLQAYALLLKGDPARCATLDLGPWAAVRAMCLGAMGRRAEARTLSDSLAERLRAGEYRLTHQYADMAAYYAWQGDVDHALEWLDRSAQVTPAVNFWQIESGLFDRVRKDPRFEAGLKRLDDFSRTRVAEERRKLGDGVR